MKIIFGEKKMEKRVMLYIFSRLFNGRGFFN